MQTHKHHLIHYKEKKYNSPCSFMSLNLNTASRTFPSSQLHFILLLLSPSGSTQLCEWRHGFLDAVQVESCACSFPGCTSCNKACSQSGHIPSLKLGSVSPSASLRNQSLASGGKPNELQV